MLTLGFAPPSDRSYFLCIEAALRGWELAAWGGVLLRWIVRTPHLRRFTVARRGAVRF
jgi:hypothetical protein